MTPRHPDTQTPRHPDTQTPRHPDTQTPRRIISITGGSGFIGKRLVERHLAQGDKVRVLSRRSDASSLWKGEVEVHSGDLATGPEALYKFVDGADVLYHCAGEIREEYRMRATHVAGAQNLLAAAKSKIGHWVQLSSVEAYGPPWSLPPGIATEDLPLKPQGEYEVTKTEADQLVAGNAGANGFSYTILRPSKVMGDGMRDRSVFQLMGLIKRGLFFFIGKPGAVQNYIPVDNVVDALMLCGSNPAAKGRTYNLSDHMTIEEFIAVIAQTLEKKNPKMRIPETAALWPAEVARAVGLKIPLTPSRVRGLLNRSIFSIERISRELHYSHKVKMSDELRQRTLSWSTPGAKAST